MNCQLLINPPLERSNSIIRVICSNFLSLLVLAFFFFFRQMEGDELIAFIIDLRSISSDDVDKEKKKKKNQKCSQPQK